MKVNYEQSLKIAKEQFLLSLHVRAVCSGPGGSLDSRLRLFRWARTRLKVWIRSIATALPGR